MSVEIKIGDALEVLRAMDSESVDMVVTSPPYWGLRDYGIEGQLGMEPTLGEHIANLVEVFEECRRVLKPHGSLWLNYGDCYATAPNGRSAADTKELSSDDRTFRDKPFSTVGPICRLEVDDTPRNRSRRGRSGNLGNGGVNGVGIPGARVVGDGPRYDPNWRSPETMKKRSGRKSNGEEQAPERAVPHTGKIVAGGYLKPKDLCMIPNRLAIALQDAGWWVRSEIVWGKPNAMPDSSGVYRPAVSHEKIFLLTKEGGDIYRARDTGELSFSPDLTQRCPLITDPSRTAARWINIETYYDAVSIRLPTSEQTNARLSQDVEAQRGSDRANGGTRQDRPMKVVGLREPGTGPKTTDTTDRSTRANGSFHAGTALRVPHRLLRNYEADLTAALPPEIIDLCRAELLVWPIPTAAYSGAHFATFPPALVAPCIMAGCPKGGVVLDPFGGAGTTALVAEALGRDSILIELKPEYAEMAELRIKARSARVRLPDANEAVPGLLGLLADNIAADALAAGKAA